MLQRVALHERHDIDKLEVDMAQLDLSDDEEEDESHNSLKDSMISRLQHESESFLASIHSTPPPQKQDLASTMQTAAAPMGTANSNNQMKMMSMKGAT